VSYKRKRLLNRIYQKSLLVADTIKYGEHLLDSLYPGMTRDEISMLLYETWSRPYIFEDFTLFKEQPYRGRYVNVDKNGFRISKNQGIWPPDKEKNFLIFIFGGSSAFGYGVSDSETVASFLQERLSKVGLKRSPVVYNFGRGHYYSTQERILFEKLLVEGYVPDMALFLDGLNEFFYYNDNGTALSSSFEKLLLGDIGELFLKELRRRFVVLRYLRDMRKRIKRLFTRNADLQRRERGTPDPARLMNIIERYIVNKRMIEACGTILGVQTVFVWEPVPGYEYDLSLHPFGKGGFGRHGYSQKGYPLMKEYMKAHSLGNNFLWCADIGKDVKEPLYVDLAHYSPRMSVLFAETICGLLRQQKLLDKAECR
jgi:hypothetical protein